jgi:hypothetical protein
MESKGILGANLNTIEYPFGDYAFGSSIAWLDGGDRPLLAVASRYPEGGDDSLAIYDVLDGLRNIFRIQRDSTQDG